jgi:glutathione S-transferase
MWQLHHFPLCPFSRKVRLLLTEKGVKFELKRASPGSGPTSSWT